WRISSITSTSPRCPVGEDSGLTVTSTRPGDRFGTWSSSRVPSGFSVPWTILSGRLMACLLRQGRRPALEEHHRQRRHRQRQRVRPAVPGLLLGVEAALVALAAAA